ncbi:hypothetical protein ACFSDD_18945 [Salipiger marinus]|uniref:hypothetical protein n=1 Tax=Salipiger marinus TaxID=555512 RepID=UPI002C388377|nr:hypothetical protein [Salipiger manganoxidans]MEB3418715.1 hypothetical protein [Salipiger manganoxidans]
MTMRSARSTVTFFNAFALRGYAGQLPAGDYEIIVEEELLEGFSFETWLRTATYLMVGHSDSQPGLAEMRAVSDRELVAVLSRDGAMTQTKQNSEAALSPLEDRT